MAVYRVVQLDESDPGTWHGIIARPDDLLFVEFAANNPATGSFAGRWTLMLRSQYILEPVFRSPDIASGPPLGGQAARRSLLAFDYDPAAGPRVETDVLVALEHSAVALRESTGFSSSDVEVPLRFQLAPPRDGRWLLGSSTRSFAGRADVWAAEFVIGDPPPTFLIDIAPVSPPYPFPAGPGGLLAIQTVDVDALAGRLFVVRRLRVSATGADLVLHGPVDPPNPGLPPPVIKGLDYVVGGGRDQVIVTRGSGYLSSGHRAERITTTQRQFSRRNEAGLTFVGAHLYVTTQLVITEPVIDYSGRENEFASGGRETPLRSLRITTDALPLVGIAASGTAWIINGAPPAGPVHPGDTTANLVQFALCGTDWSGRDVHFSMPLFFISDDELASAAAVTKLVKASPPMTAVFHPQPITLTGDPAAQAATTVSVTAMSFTLHPLTGSATAPFALVPDTFDVALEALRPFAPALTTTACRLHGAYTSGPGDVLQSAHNPAGAFLQLVDPVDAVFAAGKIGGVATPNARLAAVNVTKGLVPSGFELGAGQVPSLQDAFGNAKILGTDLLDLLGDAADQEAPTMQHVSLPDRVSVDYAWTPVLKPASGLLRLGQDSVLSLSAHFEQRLAASSQPASTVSGSLTNFAVDIDDAITVTFARLGFSTTAGSAPAITIAGCTVAFAGDLSFVNDVLDQAGSVLFGTGFAVAVAPSGISASYTLMLPSASFGVFGLTNVVLAAGVELPFDDRPPNVRFALCTRSAPFLVSVDIFGGGGYFVLVADAAHGVSIEASIEAGGVFQFDLGVVSGGVHALVGISFMFSGPRWTLGGFIRCGGYVDVLGIAGVSVEFEVMLSYSDPVITGTAEVTAGVHLFGFTKTVSFSVTKSFTVHGFAPVSEAFAALPSVLAGNTLPVDWDAYCEAFA